MDNLIIEPLAFYEQIGKSKQEELAKALFVSRTAISKWESGRGYPNIDSLKAIAKFFSITVDELLSTDEILTIAVEDGKRKEKRFKDISFGLLDISSAMLLFLPFFANKTGYTIQSASLISLIDVQIYLKVAYIAIIIGMIISGVLTLALQQCNAPSWIKSKSIISLILGTLAVLLFTISSQPYAAIFAFVLLTIKALFLIKKRQENSCRFFI